MNILRRRLPRAAPYLIQRSDHARECYIAGLGRPRERAKDCTVRLQSIPARMISRCASLFTGLAPRKLMKARSCPPEEKFNLRDLCWLLETLSATIPLKQNIRSPLPGTASMRTHSSIQICSFVGITLSKHRCQELLDQCKAIAAMADGTEKQWAMLAERSAFPLTK